MATPRSGRQNSVTLRKHDLRPLSIPVLLGATAAFLPGLLLGFLVGRFSAHSSPEVEPSALPSRTRTSGFPSGRGKPRRRPSATPSAVSVSGSGGRSSGSGNATGGDHDIASKAQSRSSLDASTDLKMVLVVRQDLKMGSGKVAAQCAHAAVGAVSDLARMNASVLRRYEEAGEPKIVVCCRNLKEMQELQGQAHGRRLPTFVVADAGRTQVAAGTKTVMAVGPGEIE